MEHSELPTPCRLTWLVGPPGAGKSTFSRYAEHGFRRVVELSEILSPLIEPAGITRGVLQANGALVEMIRDLEFHPDNRQHEPLLVVAGLAPERHLLPVRPDESIWLLRPPRDRWRKQLYNRPTDDPENPQYADYEYAETWYQRFDGWDNQDGVITITTGFDATRIGTICI